MLVIIWKTMRVSVAFTHLCFLPAPLLAPAPCRGLPPHHCCVSRWLSETRDDDAKAAPSWNRWWRHHNSWVRRCPVQVCNAPETHQVAVCSNNNPLCVSHCLLVGVISPFTFDVMINLLGFKSDILVSHFPCVLTIFHFSVSFFSGLFEQFLDFYFDLLIVVF